MTGKEKNLNEFYEIEWTNLNKNLDILLKEWNNKRKLKKEESC